MAEPLREDWERVLEDVREALATGREPEDVQAERHSRERDAAGRAQASARRASLFTHPDARKAQP